MPVLKPAARALIIPTGSELVDWRSHAADGRQARARCSKPTPSSSGPLVEACGGTATRARDGRRTTPPASKPPW
ncbi:MAG: hypothetical protein MZV70_02990 [Desulfobacterales bacterium]|nr:hypothetical protein [Desulfobacterales bacterium]